MDKWTKKDTSEFIFLYVFTLVNIALICPTEPHVRALQNILAIATILWGIVVFYLIFRNST